MSPGGTEICRGSWDGKACDKDSEGLQFLGERKVTEGLGMWELELETSKACEHWGNGMHERLVVVNAAELVIESCREHKKLRALRARHAVQKNLLLLTLLNL